MLHRLGLSLGGPLRGRGDVMTASLARRGVLVLLTVSTVLVVGAGLAWACTATAEISVRPHAAQVGGYVTVHGERLSQQPGTEVTVRWHTADGQLLATATGPEFSVGFRVPDVPEGTYAIVATSSNGTARHPFTVTSPRPQPEDAPVDNDTVEDDTTSAPDPLTVDPDGQRNTSPEPGDPAQVNEPTRGSEQPGQPTEPVPHASDERGDISDTQEFASAPTAGNEPPPAALVPAGQSPPVGQTLPRSAPASVDSPPGSASAGQAPTTDAPEAPVRPSAAPVPAAPERPSRATTDIPWALLAEAPGVPSPATEPAVDLGVVDAWSGLASSSPWGLGPSGQQPPTVKDVPSWQWSLPAGVGLLSGGLVVLFAGFFVLVVGQGRVALPVDGHRDE